MRHLVSATRVLVVATLLAVPVGLAPKAADAATTRTTKLTACARTASEPSFSGGTFYLGTVRNRTYRLIATRTAGPNGCATFRLSMKTAANLQLTGYKSIAYDNKKNKHLACYNRSVNFTMKPGQSRKITMPLSRKSGNACYLE